MPRPVTLQGKHDMSRAKRLAEVRSKYIHKNQGEANTMLGLSRGVISTLERGQISITVRFLEKLIPYGINPNYVLHGELPKKLDENVKTNTLLDVKSLSNRIDKLELVTKILTGNLDKAWQLIERHEKTIDELERQLVKR